MKLNEYKNKKMKDQKFVKAYVQAQLEIFDELNKNNHIENYHKIDDKSKK